MEVGLNTEQITLTTASVNAKDLLNRIIYPQNYATATISATDWIVGVVDISSLLLPKLFKCPYCDSYSNEPGICKNCGGVKEIVR
jgi:hypothetical protein